MESVGLTGGRERGRMKRGEERRNEKRNGEREGLILSHSSRAQSIMVGKSGQQELEAPSHSVSGARRRGGW